MGIIPMTGFLPMSLLVGCVVAKFLCIALCFVTTTKNVAICLKLWLSTEICGSPLEMCSAIKIVALKFVAGHWNMLLAEEIVGKLTSLNCGYTELGPDCLAASSLQPKNLWEQPKQHLKIFGNGIYATSISITVIFPGCSPDVVPILLLLLPPNLPPNSLYPHHPTPPNLILCHVHSVNFFLFFSLFGILCGKIDPSMTLLGVIQNGGHRS